MERILITGAAGQIGKALRQGRRGSYPLVRLLDSAPLGYRGRRSRRYMPR
jgi:uronate dehydrogenase